LKRKLKNFRKKINENPEKFKNYEILRKYLWLRWNQDENSSKIKFEWDCPILSIFLGGFMWGGFFLFDLSFVGFFYS
jgi:DNA-binding ferritin-like protein (Dps family)